MSKQKMIKPTAAEDRAINASIAADPDTIELTEDMAAQLRRPSKKILALHRRGRGKQKAPTKVAKSMRLSQDVLEAFAAHTDKVSTSIDEVLRDFAVSAGWIDKNDKAAPRNSAALAQRGVLARKARSGVNPFTAPAVEKPNAKRRVVKGKVARATKKAPPKVKRKAG